MEKRSHCLLAAVSLLLLLSGCSTMNQAECVQADWQIIGQADASKGEHSAILDEYRADCAKFSVVPNREAYFLGYEQGLQQFCTRASGFYFGKKGGVYSGICPKSLEAAFLEGYNPGHELFMIRDELVDLRSSLSSAEGEIRSIERKIKRKEDQLVSDKSTQTERERLLREIREHHREIFWLRQDARDAQDRILIRQMEYDRKQQTSPL